MSYIEWASLVVVVCLVILSVVIYLLVLEDRKAERRYEQDSRNRQFQRWIDDWKIDS